MLRLPADTQAAQPQIILLINYVLLLNISSEKSIAALRGARNYEFYDFFLRPERGGLPPRGLAMRRAARLRAVPKRRRTMLRLREGMSDSEPVA
jgi:hypothetical protein